MAKIFNLYPRFVSTRPIHVTIPKRYSYFWEVAAFLSKMHEIDSIDAIDNKYTTFEISRFFAFGNYSIVTILARVDNIREALKMGSFIKQIDPNVKIIFYGDVVNLLPSFFIAKDYIDAIVSGGDWELALSSYFKYIEEKTTPVGVYVKDLNKNFPGKTLGSSWHFTDIAKAPYDIYNNLNHKKELSLTVSRGCPFNCRFCMAVSTFGHNDRRKDIAEILDYIQTQHNNFESFKFFSPNFTFNNDWVSNFTSQIKNRDLKIKWSSTCRIESLQDEKMIKDMADSGCYKISVGIDINGGEKYLNRNKSTNQKLIENTAKLFRKYGITLKGLVMLGVPGQTRDALKSTFDFMDNNKIIIRPTSYSPLDLLAKSENLSVSKIEQHNKFTYYEYGIKHLSKSDYFKLILNPRAHKEILK